MRKATQNRFFSANTPVIRGPRLCADVLTTLMKPMIAVLSFGSTTAARKADRGATSILCVQLLRIRNIIAKGRLFGSPIQAKAIADGRWVNTIVLTLPKRFAMLAATRTESAEMILVVKNSDPR